MIIALVMAGGKGTRLKSDIEKPIFPIKGKPLINYVLDNLNKSKYIEKIVVAVSPNDENTKNYLMDDLNFLNFNKDFYDRDDVNFCLDTKGLGFVEDLSYILDCFQQHSTEDILLFINADLPLVNENIIDCIIEYYLDHDKPALSTLVPTHIFEEYGIPYSYDFNGKVPAGINILRSENVIQDEELLIISRYELVFNINTVEAAILVSRFL